MKYRTLGKTDLEVSTVAFGCWAIVGGFTWGPQDEAASVEALRAAYESGVTFFDSAEGYGDGQSEKLVARALGDVRDSIVIATKVSRRHFDRSELVEACDRSLQNLGTDRIDLYQLHWPSRDIPVAETLGILEDLKQAGKIRTYGVSNFGPVDLGECLESGRTICSNQVAYSLLFRAIEFDIRSICVRADVSILTYSPMMQGLLTGKFVSPDDVPEERRRTRLFSRDRPNTRHDEEGVEEEAFAAVEQVRQIADELGEPMADVSLAWLLAQPGVTCVIAGGRNAEQARANVRAAELTLSADVLSRLSSATESVKEKLGPNADMWQSDSRIR